ncbi:MAG: rRNA maturation RNase YbeY [Nitratireductor sp.]|nr:rRNA maturation RNase YbeY [Nitratireductor sp.]
MRVKTPQIDIAIDHDGWPAETVLHELVSGAVGATAENLDLDWADGAELSLLFTGDEHMAEINGQWRGKPKPTNVLSFPGEERQIGEAAGMMIGDLVFALETIQREAAEQEKSFENHLTHLAVHGFLHLFGYDHEEMAEAERMEAAEIRVLKALGIGDPYAYLGP